MILKSPRKGPAYRPSQFSNSSSTTAASSPKQVPNWFQKSSVDVDAPLPSKARDVLRGSVAVVTYSNPETGYAVLKIDHGKKRSTVTGLFPAIAEGANFIDIEMEFSGFWKRTQYGPQLDCDSSKILSDSNFFFLCKFTKGVGVKLARVILEHFPENLADVLTNSPKDLLAVPGVGAKKLQTITASWEKHGHLQALSAFFSEKRLVVSPLQIIRIQKHFGSEAVEVLSTNPYRLTDIRGVGFKTADKLARGLGLDPLAPERLQAGLKHFLYSSADADGHTLQVIDDALEDTAELLSDEAAEVDVPTELIHEALDTMLFNRDLYMEVDTLQIGLIGFRIIEEEIRNTLRTRPKLKFVGMADSKIRAFQKAFEASQGYSLSPQQSDLLNLVTSGNPTTALTGHAGTGKTTACTAALKLLQELPGIRKSDIMCCAFTGMAAARIREITGFQSMTIHSLLKFTGKDFAYNRDNKLPYKVLILDEASMVNLMLFKHLLRAVGNETLFLLVGDPAQLLPIGAGNVFSDLVNNNYLPSVKLTKIYRQSEDSVLTLFANEIRSGSCPKESYAAGWSDFAFQRVEPKNINELKKADASEAALKTARELNNSAILTTIRAITRDAILELDNPVWDFQVLSPIRSGPLGTENLNINLQELLNPARPSVPSFDKFGKTLRLGDKVVHLQNKDMAVMEATEFKRTRHFYADSYTETRVYNGSLGIVEAIDEASETFIVCHADGRAVQYSFNDFVDILEHAFALTVHKAQGSQYKRVVIPMTSSHWMMLNAKWLYTAITRAVDHVALIGQPRAYRHGCTNLDEVTRQTSLSLASFKDAS